MRFYDPAPLVVDGRGPAVFPTSPLTFRLRSNHPLHVYNRTVYLRTVFGWVRIQRGYVTDFASIPTWATVLSFTDLQPMGPHAMGAGGHDMGYAIGEPGMRPTFDHILLNQMITDEVPRPRRDIIFVSVRLGGQGGYDKAQDWWETEGFADPVTGEYPVKPPFPRHAAFRNAQWGLRPAPDWDERLLLKAA